MSEQGEQQKEVTHNNLAKHTSNLLRGAIASSKSTIESNAAIIKNLEEENVRDPLTGAYNRRYFDRVLEDRLSSASPISLIMIDVDHFKDFNDAYGHKTGDRLLINLVRKITDNLRVARPPDTQDVVARYGGEEFAIILAGSNDPEKAKLVAENLRSIISKSTFMVDEKTPVRKTISMGVAVSRQVDNPDELTIRADKALYEAKEQGRDKVVVSAS